MPTPLEVSWRSIVRFFVIGIAVLAVYFFRDLIALFLSAVVIATVAEGPVKQLVRRGVPRFAAVMLIYLWGVTAVAALIYFLAPVVAREASGAVVALTDLLKGLLQATPLTSDVWGDVQRNLLGALKGLGDSASAAFGFAYRLVGGILSAVLAFVISFYLSLQGQTIERFAKVLVHEEHRKYFLDLWARSQRKIGKWFYGQMILSVFVGLLVFIGLWFIPLVVFGAKINYAFALAALAAVFEIVPVVGPIVAGVFAVAIAAHQSAGLAFYAILLFVAVQQIENNLFVPAVMKRSLGLNPVVVVFALLIGGKIAGFWGLLLAVPLTAALSELILDWEEKKFPS